MRGWDKSKKKVAYCMTKFPALKLQVVMQRLLQFPPSEQMRHQLLKIWLLLQKEECLLNHKLRQ
jgi:hypothetical protein